MKFDRKNRLLTAVLVAVMALCIAGYSRYTQRQIYYESTQNLISTYGQVNKTFQMFTQRNWNILMDWASYLRSVSVQEDPETGWRVFIQDKESWQYSDFYVFNQDCNYWTVGGRKGTAEHVREAFEELYAANEPIVTSYISSDDVRKVLFAVPLEEPIMLDGVEYTALAVSYDNTVMENMIGGMAYDGQSDCYIIRSNGDVVLSTEPKTEITVRLDNLFDYLRANAVVKEPYFEQMIKSVPEKGTGSVTYRFQGKDYYLVYQPVGFEDWSIVGIVNDDIVDDGMRKVQLVTIGVLLVLAGIILLGTVQLIIARARNRLQKEEQEKLALARQQELTAQMFQGMARIVDRFAICDLMQDHYEYHERCGSMLYPAEGSYKRLLEQISLRYAVLTDSENAKLSQLLSPENLRRELKSEADSMKFEYGTRDKKQFFMMNVVPTHWENGELTQFMMISQDMGQQHELENIANTDALTGLFNQRYFKRVLKILSQQEKRFALFYLDLNRFKPVNDTYGHDMGDKLLQRVARRLQGCVRSCDYAFRLGGDEFVLLVVGEMNEELCRERMLKVRTAVGAPYEIDGRRIEIGTSIGCAIFPDDSADAESVRALADQRMYRDKKRCHAEEER